MWLTRFITYLKNKIKYARYVGFDKTVTILSNSSFEGANRIGKHSMVKGHFGFGTYCGNHCSLQGQIGRFCSFGENCKTIFWTHPYTYPFVSTSPMFYSLRKQSGIAFAKAQIFNEILPPPDFWE